MDEAAQWIGYAVMIVAAYGLLGLIVARITQWLWDHARPLGMIRDFHRWYRKKPTSDEA